MFLCYLVPWPSVYIYGNFDEDHPSVGLNARGVAKYSDFGPVKGYILETVQDRS